MRRVRAIAALVVIYVVVAHVLPPPDGVQRAGWHVTGAFLATIVGFVLRPLPGGALVIIALSLLVLTGALPIDRALAGFSSSTVWLVVAAMLMSQALRNTGAARRVALLFVEQFGRSSLGISYALLLCDMALGGGIPSITARSGGIILPIAQGIAELYKSRPGPSAALLGTFLMITLYQGSVIVCAMFLTGNATNVLVARLAPQLAGVQVTWASWLLAGLVPGILCALIVPYAMHRLFPPEIRRTPAAAEYARQQLQALGPLKGPEAIVLCVFIAVITLWVSSGWHGMDVTAIALAAVSVLFISGALTWERSMSDASVWDIFVWYGGLVALGEALSASQVTKVFAAWIGGVLPAMPLIGTLFVLILVYFYAHYCFASITVHLMSLFPPFVTLLIALGAPAGLVVYSLGCLVNLTAGLTHYGTTTAPMVFGLGYVGLGVWWRAGLIASALNLAIWMTAGFAWWKVIGIW